MAYVYKFIPRSFFGLPQETIVNIAEATQSIFKSVADPTDHYCRIIIHNSRYNLDPVIQRLTTQRARSGKTWMMQGLTSLINSFRKNAQENLFQTYVYLVLYDRKLEDANDFARLFSTQTGMYQIGTPHDAQGLPKIVETVARVTDRYLFTPPSQYWRGLYITDLLGVHNVFQPIFNLLNQPFELMVAFDIRSFALSHLDQTLNITFNRALAEGYKNTSPLTRPKVERRIQILNDVKNLIATKQEGLHEIKGAIAFSAPTLEDLSDNEAKIQAAVNGYYTVGIPRGMQAHVMRMFTTDHPANIPTPGDIKKSVVSSNIAFSNVVGNGFPEPGGSDGIWYGNSYLNGHPILYNGFGENKNDANHTIVLGSTGSGKTVLLQTLAYRSLLEGQQVIVLEPRGHFRRLQSVVEGDSVYNDMAFQEGYSINLFDVVYRDLNDQISHVVNALSLLLQKEFNEVELAVIRNEATNLYQSFDSIILEHLVNGLRQEKWTNHLNYAVRDAAANIADLIDISILNTELDKIFNRKTRGINLNLDSIDLAVFDFERVSTEYRALLYYLVLANIHNYCVEHKNERNRIVIVDEYYLMSQIPALAESLSLFFKTFRTYGVGCWVAEQDWYTLTGFEGQQNKHGEYLVSNASNVIALYHNTLRDAQALKAIIPELNDDLLSYITGARRPGTGICKLKQKIMPFHLQLTEQEQNLFLGS